MALKQWKHVRQILLASGSSDTRLLAYYAQTTDFIDIAPKETLIKFSLSTSNKG